MTFHYGYWPFHSGLLVFGQTGVDLFFVLSGFLISTILLQSPHGSWQEVRKFYIPRTLRIFPLYYGYLLIACVVAGTVSWWYWVYLQNIAASFQIALHLAPLRGPNHFWSLGVEEQFYLVWPFLILFLPRRLLAGAMWGTIGFSLVLRIVLAHTTVDLFPFTLTRLDALAAGGLVALYYQQGMLARFRPQLAWMIVLAIVSLGAEKRFSQGTGLEWVEVIKYTSAAALYAGCVGLIISTSGTSIHRLLRSRAVRGIGRVSYGMYVFHPAIFGFLPRHLGQTPALAKALICFLAAYAVSVVSFYGFEKRFTNMKDKLAPEKPFSRAHGEIMSGPAGDVAIATGGNANTGVV